MSRHKEKTIMEKFKKIIAIIAWLSIVPAMYLVAGTVTKGLIGKQDISLWDGTSTKTFTRDSSEGYTLTLNQLDWVGVDVFQKYGGGASRTDTTLTTALTAVGSSNKVTFWFSPGTWTITDDVTITSNITAHIPAGAVFLISSGKTITINGPFNAGLYRVFSGSGAASFGLGSTMEVYPQWWDVVADGTSVDDEVAINAAIVAANGLVVKMPPSANPYEISNPIVVYPGTRLIGSGTSTANKSQIKLADGVDDNVIESSNWDAAAEWIHWMELSHFVIDGNKSNNASTSAGIAIYQMGETSIIHNILIDECNDYGIYIKGTSAPNRISNVSVFDSGVAAFYLDQTGAAVTTLDNVSGDNNQIFVKWAGLSSTVLINPKIEGDHDPCFDVQFNDPSGNYYGITVIGGYANADSIQTDLFKIDTAGGSAQGPVITLLNFRKYNYTNIFNDVDTGQTYASTLQSLAGFYQFNGNIRLYGEGEISLPFNRALVTEGSLEGTEFDAFKQSADALRIQSGVTGGFAFRETGMSNAEVVIQHRTTELTSMSGATVTWNGGISAGIIVLGVTARVTTLITGATSFDVGVSGGDTDLFIDGMNVALDTTGDLEDSNAAFSSPLINQSTASIVVTANGGNFAAGALRLVIHYIDLTAPTS